MKFLAFTDIHENKAVLQELVRRAAKDDILFALCCGDFSTFGRGAGFVLKRFNQLGKPLYIIPGNHEERTGFLDSIVPEYPHCLNFDRGFFVIGEYVFLGYGGGGFSMEDKEFRKVAREWYGKHKEKKTILVTHGPPFGTKLDLLGNRHVGNKDYRAFIERMKPKLAISGHLHETVGVTDAIGKTKLLNPGWDGMVIELK